MTIEQLQVELEAANKRLQHVTDARDLQIAKVERIRAKAEATQDEEAEWYAWDAYDAEEQRLAELEEMLLEAEEEVLGLEEEMRSIQGQ